MPRSRHSQATILQMAIGLLERREAIEPGISERLRSDLHAAVSSRTDVVIVHDSSRAAASTCSIAAAYLRGSNPPRIVLTGAASYARELFSLGHEFGHFLIDQDEVLADELFHEPDRGVALEEDICDVFAACLLLADELIDEALDGGGVTAASVLALHQRSEASREACAVAMAQRLGTPGYVLIGASQLDEDGEQEIVVRFAARANGALPIRRGTPQPGTLLADAFKRGRARGQGQLYYPSGAQTEFMHIDIRTDGGYAFGVLVSDNPAWGGLSVRDPAGGGFANEWCDHCSSEFYPSGPACSLCGNHTCPTCRRCACAIGASPDAMVCSQCYLEKPGILFDGTLCDECSE